MKKIITLVAVILAALSNEARAQSLALLDTGAGQYSNNNFGISSSTYLKDPNWTVSLVSINSGQTPPGGDPTGTAYLVPNDGTLVNGDSTYPFGGYWTPNNSTSCWISYSDPTQVGSDYTNDVFQYQLTFKALSSGTVTGSYLTDNTAVFDVNGVQISSNSNLGVNSTYSTATDFSFSAVANSIYKIDVIVDNTNGGPNATGADVQLSGIQAAVIPEPSCWMLLLLSLGVVVYFHRGALRA
jgi:hypothetical protein